MDDRFEYYFLKKLRDLQQTSTVDQYYSHFGFLSMFVLFEYPWICAQYFLSTFILGLNQEIQAYVLQFHPTNVVDAYDLAYFQGLEYTPHGGFGYCSFKRMEYSSAVLGSHSMEVLSSIGHEGVLGCFFFIVGTNQFVQGILCFQGRPIVQGIIAWRAPFHCTGICMAIQSVSILGGKFTAAIVLFWLFQHVSYCDFCSLYFNAGMDYKSTWYVLICHMVTTLGNRTVLVCLILENMPSNSEIAKDILTQYIQPLEHQVLLFFDLEVPSSSMVLVLAFMWTHCTTHIPLSSFQQHMVFSLAATPCFIEFEAGMVLVQECHHGNATFQPKFQITLAVSFTAEVLVHVTAFAAVRKSETNLHKQ